MALPVQLFLAGPVARWLFRLLFRRVNGAQEKQIEKELRKAGIVRNKVSCACFGSISF